MRQFYKPINKMLTQGLAPLPAVPSEGMFLSTCSNFKPMTGGLQGLQKYVRTFTQDAGKLFITTQGIFLFTSTNVYSYDGVNVTSVLAGITGGTDWFVADFSKYMVFTNGTKTIVYDGAAWAINNNAIIPQANCICNAQGRAILGGFAGALNKVAWSEIGAMKFLLEADPSTLYKNTAGFRFMDWPGEVLCIYELGGGRAAVLGSGGVSCLVPASVEPYAYGTLGLREVSAVGLGSRRGAVKMATGIYFVNLNNELCFIKANDISLQVLGYSDYLDSTTCKLSYDSTLNELYIAQPGITYILTAKGLGVVSAELQVAYSNTLKKLIVQSNGVITQTDAEFTSDVLTFEQEGFKTVEDIHINGDNFTTTYGCVEYKGDHSKSFVISPWKQFNSFGYCHIGITAGEFKIKVKLANYTTPIIKDVKVGVKFTDRRFIKGIVLNDNKVTTGTD